MKVKGELQPHSHLLDESKAIIHIVVVERGPNHITERGRLRPHWNIGPQVLGETQIIVVIAVRKNICRVVYRIRQIGLGY